MATAQAPRPINGGNRSVLGLDSPIDRVASLLREGRAVQARVEAARYSQPGLLVGLSDSERGRLASLASRADGLIASLRAGEMHKQSAEVALMSDDLVGVERHARAVLASSDADDSERAVARTLMDLASQRKRVLQSRAGETLEDAWASFEAGEYGEAKRAIEGLSRSGVALERADAERATSLRLRIAELESEFGRPFAIDALSLALVEPPEERAGWLLSKVGEGEEVRADLGVTAQPEGGQPESPVDSALRVEAGRLLAAAEQAFNDRRLAEAERIYIRLLAPQGEYRRFLNDDQIALAEERRREARLALGGGGQPDQGPLGQEIIDREVRRQEANAQFESRIEAANDLLGQGDFAGARDEAAAARLLIQRERDVFSQAELDDYVGDATSLISEINEAERAAEILRTEAESERLRSEAAARERELADERQRRINALIERVRELQAEEDYEAALQEVEQILFLEPRNPAGLLLQDVIRQTIIMRRYLGAMNERNIRLADIQTTNYEATIPPTRLVEYPDDWVAISQRRSSPLAFADSEANRAVLTRLRDQREPIAFNDNALEDILNFVASVGEFDMDVDWESLDEIGVSQGSTVSLNLTSVPLEAVLDRVLEKASSPDQPAGWAVYDGVLTVASDEVLRRNTVLEIYDVSDLLIEVPDYENAPEFDLNSVFSQGGQGGGGGQSPFQQNQQDQPIIDKEALLDELEEIIRNNVDNEGWADFGGDTGRIERFRNSLIVRNTPKNHRAIQGLLDQLRAVRNLQINVESRFLLVTEDFFEQIGFDLDIFIGGQDEYEDLRNDQLIFDPSNGTFSVQPGDPGLLPSDFFDPATAQLTGARNISSTAFVLDTDGDLIPDTPISQAVPAPGGFSTVGIQQNSIGLTEALGASADFAASVVQAGAPALGIAGRFLDDVQVDFLVEATQADRRSLQLTAPRLTFTNGQASNIFVATQISFVSDQEPVVSDSAVAFDPELDVVSEGVNLVVQGVVSADRRYVTLNVRTQTGEVDLSADPIVVEAQAGGAATGTVAGIPISEPAQATIQTPVVTITSVETTVTVPDQGTILLGGQRVVNEVETETGVPILSKIPFINRFFTNRIETKTESTVLILLRPEIIIQSEEEELAFPGLLDSLSR
ncbi:MAG: hypothetical protein AAFQ71_01855 [Planctomycetota bacterium]